MNIGAGMTPGLQGFAGIGLIGIVIGLWNNIKVWISKITSLVLVRIEVKGYAPTIAISKYLIEHYKYSPLGKKEFFGRTEYVRPNNRNQLVMFEEIPSENTLWWKKDSKRKILWVSKQENQIKLAFLRWDHKSHSLLTTCSDHYNDYLINDEKNWRDDDRFYIIKKYGSIGQRNRTESNGVDKAQDIGSPSAPADRQGGDRISSIPLKWTQEQLGLPKKESAVHELSLQKEHIDALNDMFLWRDSEKWFKERSIPWKKGLLLHGKPGTGKTAFVRALGQELNMPIVVFDLATMTNQDFNQEWRSTLSSHCPCICLFEDIDGIFNGGENITTKGKMDAGISFDCLLNSLDGVENTDGLVIVVTTNNIDKLDSAIGIPDNGDNMSSRPGRIDRTLEFVSLDEEGREKMAKRILGDFERSLWQHVMDKGKEHKDTGAQFQERCVRVAIKLFWETKTQI